MRASASLLLASEHARSQYGYQGFAGLSALRPVPDCINPASWQTFGKYMNGGSLLCQTYWEVVARARAGDHEGAARRLKLFARRAAEISWAGDTGKNKPKPLDWRLKRYDEVVGRGANWLLDVAPDQTGRIPQDQVEALLELKRAVDSRAKR